MKKIMIIFLLAVFGGVSFMVLNQSKSEASQVHYKMEASNGTVKKGEEVNVTFSVTGEEPMNSVDAYVYYDDSVLEFVKADKEVFTGTTGVLRLSDVFAEEVTEVTYHLTFKALEVGSSTLKVQEVFVGEEEAGVSKVENTTATIVVKENLSESQDATLKTLDVFPGELSPAFSSEVTSYKMTVDSETDDIVISAVPADKESIVKVSGNENFKTGSNTVTILVKSMSGIEREYTIFVNKQ